MTDRLTVASLSAAMDGGLTAIADVAAVLDRAGKLDDGRLIGGVAVLLHQQRLVVDLHLRATADADLRPRQHSPTLPWTPRSSSFRDSRDSVGCLPKLLGIQGEMDLRERVGPAPDRAG